GGGRGQGGARGGAVAGGGGGGGGAGVALSARPGGGGAGLRREILARRGVQDGARRADDEPGARASAAACDDLVHIPSLRTDPRHEERHVADQRAYHGELARIRRAVHEQPVATRIPAPCRELRHHLVERPAVDRQVL